MKTVGIALGSGGARGLAHIVILEALEELGIRPSVVAGTSIGAVIGAGLAAGLSTAEMRQAVGTIRKARRGKFWNVYENEDFNLLLSFIDPTRETGGLIKGEKFTQFLRQIIGVDRFEQLKIPLKLVATDYWHREEVVLDSGDLLTAVRASYAMPGLFTPVIHGTTLLVDGGLRNPLPYDLIRPLCDISVAIDVSSDSAGRSAKAPHAYEVLFMAFQIMQNSIVREKLKYSCPDILIKAKIKNVRSLEFSKVQSIYDQAAQARKELRNRLAEMFR